MRRNALYALAVAALLVTAGCTGLSTNDATDAEELQADAADAMADAETYQMELRMNVSASGQTVRLTQHAVFDHAAERARVNASMAGRETTTYIDGDTAYVNVGGVWRTRDLSASEPWNRSAGLRQQRAVLESGNVSVTGSARVLGVETTVLTVDADAAELQSVVSQQSGTLDGTSIEDATYRMYVANDTHRLRKVEMDMEMTVGDQSAVANATITFSEYGDPVNVSIPEEAVAQSARDPVAG